jgi:transcriptional regulator with XRE-family HTH domain
MQETIGHRLKQIRLSRQISIEKAAEATRVRTHYLQALEADNYSAMSSAAQGRGFLRLYADYLGLDLEAAMNELRRDETVDAPPETSAPAPTTQAPEPIPAPQTPPASPADGKPVRRPFWSRLLRRPVAEPSALEDAAPAAESAPDPIAVPEPEPAPTRAKKPAKNTRIPAKTSRPKTVKPKPAAKPTVKKEDKKKASLKSQPSKKRR